MVKGVSDLVVNLPAPPNLSVLWNFGSLMGLCLVAQIITGLVLAMHYTPHVEHAFVSCIHIIRDVNFGWIVRAGHVNGASFFFFFLYLHVGRGIYSGRYRQWKTWAVGVLLFIVLMGIAFMGYVLVWGQISLWAATVIINLLSAIPYVGSMVVEWVWGGFAVNDATLHRFYVFHFLLPFLLGVLTFVHLAFLHTEVSRNPLGCGGNMRRVPFHPFYVWKDLLGVLIALIGVVGVSLFFSDMFLEPENFIPANALVTPAHIKPEWYFLWVYAILRAVPNKLGGVVAMFLAILVPLVLPLIVVDGTQKGCGRDVVRQGLFWGLAWDFFFLTWLGGCPAEAPYEGARRVMGFFFFFFFFFFSFWVNRHWVDELHGWFYKEEYFEVW